MCQLLIIHHNSRDCKGFRKIFFDGGKIQRLCLWTPRDSVGDTFMQCPRVYPGNGKIKKRIPKSNLSGEPEGVKGAIGKPPCRLRRGETLCNNNPKA